MIEIHNVTKEFKDEVALQECSLTIEEGRTFGIVGLNGSGKTVLFKIITGLIRPTKGYVIVNGQRIGKDIDFIDNAGVLIEHPNFISGYSAVDNLKFIADVQKKIGIKEIEDVLKSVGLYEAKDKRVGKFSLGMKQRLRVAQAIMEDPKILILDEPFNGLDKTGVEEVRKLLLAEKAKGKTILLTSHNEQDIAILCDEVIEMDRGSIIKKEKIDE